MAADRRPCFEINGIHYDEDGTLLDFHATWMRPVRIAAAALADGTAKYVGARGIGMTGFPIVGRRHRTRPAAHGRMPADGLAWRGV